MSTLATVFGYGLLSARPAASIAGRQYYATDTSLLYRDNGSSWDTLSTSGLTNPMTTKGDVIMGDTAGVPARLAAGTSGQVLTANGAAAFPSWQALLGTWTTYSPTWTSDGSAPTLSNGTLTGRYKQLDSKTYAIQINFVFGSLSSAGTGNYSFSLPAGLTSGALVQVLAGVVLDSGTRYYLGAGYIAAGGTTVTWIVNSESGGAGRTGQTTPMTFATGDEINLSGIIEVA